MEIDGGWRGGGREPRRVVSAAPTPWGGDRGGVRWQHHQ